MEKLIEVARKAEMHYRLRRIDPIREKETPIKLDIEAELYQLRCVDEYYRGNDKRAPGSSCSESRPVETKSREERYYRGNDKRAPGFRQGSERQRETKSHTFSRGKEKNSPELVSSKSKNRGNDKRAPGSESYRNGIDPKSIKESMDRRLRDATSDYHSCSESLMSECSSRGQRGRRGITESKGRMKGVSKSPRPAPSPKLRCLHEHTRCLRAI
eukprot:GHVU01077451.1.p1 GENE.GHVU01077451.1~~GHVU01077451.1.p1  ORF type:complete len:214 (+),score=8.83 GHVU01077451.1:142-783(+)